MNINNKYIVNNNIEKILKGKYTYFLDSRLQQLIKKQIHKHEYKVYLPYKDSEKVIYYKNLIPNVLLYEIISSNHIKHQDIMGSLFNLGINPSMYGDIIIIDNKYYIYILDVIEKYLINNLKKINNCSVVLKKINNNFLINYERKYENIELLVSSERIDNVVSKIIHNSRKIVNNIINNKDVLVNYDTVKKKLYSKRRRYYKY